MIKLNASFSKKVPAEQEYSSKSFMACVEVELPTGVSAKELKDKIHDTFALVQGAVEEEIAGKASGTSSQQAPRLQGRSQGSQQSRSSKEGNRATAKQIQYILSLGKEQHIGLPELNRQVADLYGAGNVYDLSKHDASKFVDVLKQAA